MNPLVISTLILVFQTIVTVVVVFVLLLALAGVAALWKTLIVVLFLEWVAMVLCLFYHFGHRDEGSRSKVDWKLLISHGLLSLLALLWATWFIWRGFSGNFKEISGLFHAIEIIGLVWAWLVALVSGVFVFLLKHERSGG